MSERMVMAIGVSGKPELAPESETVEIECIPLADDHLIIPATLRCLRRNGEGTPLRLRQVRRANTRLNRRPYPVVEFHCTPFVRYTHNGVSLYGHWSSCCVRNEHDAKDPLFDSLSIKERFRILQSVRNMSKTRKQRAAPSREEGRA